MKWSDDFSTGVPELDKQHKMLFVMSQDFRLAIAEGRGRDIYGGFLQSLELYCQAHFGMEEKCMFRYKCPAYDVNKNAHGLFMKKIDELAARFDKDGYSAGDAQAACLMVERWLTSHIAQIDVQLRPLAEPG